MSCAGASGIFGLKLRSEAHGTVGATGGSVDCAPDARAAMQSESRTSAGARKYMIYCPADPFDDVVVADLSSLRKRAALLYRMSRFCCGVR